MGEVGGPWGSGFGVWGLGERSRYWFVFVLLLLFRPARQVGPKTEFTSYSISTS